MKKFLFLIALVCAPVGLYAQTNAGALLPALPQQFLTANGTPAANGRICTSVSGTNTPLAVYSDAGLTVALPNPIKLNSAGIAITAGGTQTAVYTLARSYRVTLYAAGTTSNLCNGTAVGTLLWQFDNVYDFGQLNGGSGGGGGGGPTGQCNAAAQTGADAAAKITACAVSLPTGGGIINAEGLQGAQAWGACPSFPSSQITLLLGVGVYTITPTCSMPTNVETNFPVGSSLAPASGKTLQINGPIVAGSSQQIFTGTGTVTTPGQTAVYPQWWGALANATFLGGPIGGGTGCNMTATTTTITCPTANFTTADVGKTFDLSHAGVNACGNAVFGNNVLKMNCNLVGTISSVTNITTIVVSIAAGSTVTNEQFTYGNGDDAAVQAALNSGAQGLILSGSYALTSNVGGASGNAVQATLNNFTFRGINGRFVRLGPVAYGGHASGTLGLLNGSSNVTFDNVTIVGTNELGELTDNGLGHDGLGICTGFAGACGSAIGITNIVFSNCHFDYTWGIGVHNAGSNTIAGTQINNLTFNGGDAQYNSFDGYNIDTYDGVFFTNVIGDHNGTGGIEMATFGSYAIESSHFRYNHALGVSIGGFTDNHTEFTTGSIIGNDLSFNGNNYTTNTIGVGIGLGNGGPRNVTVSGNTIYRNHLGGINVNTNPQDQQYTIVGNVISSNGIVGAGGGTVPFGINCALCNNSVVGDNLILDENTVGILTASRTSNVVTVQTTVAHNFQVGYSVTITGTPSGVFDGTFTVTSLGSGAGTPNATIFTFAQTAANLGAQLGGSATSQGSGFQQSIGFENGANTVNLRVHHNNIFGHSINNVSLNSTGASNFTFESDVNYIATSGKDVNISGPGESRNGLTVKVPTLNYFDCPGTTGDIGAALITCEGALSAIPQGGTINVTAFTGLVQSDPFTGVTKNIHFIFNGGVYEFLSPVSVSVPVNVTIELRNGAHFLVDSGATLSIAGNIIAPQGQQIFFGTGAISFTAANRTPFVSSLWFGDSKPLQETIYFSTNAGGANNAWVLNATGVPLSTGLKLSVNVDTFSLQAGANTLNFNSSGAKNIDKATAIANLGSAVNTGALVELVYDGTQWRLLGQ